MKRKIIRYITGIMVSIIGMYGIGIACSLPPDIIHEFRIDTASGGNARIHYTLMAWNNLHTEILEKISKETNVSVNSENLDKIYQKYLLAHSELYINDKQVQLTFLTGTVNSSQGNSELVTYNPESFIEMEFETDFSSDLRDSTTIRLEFRKELFRDITSLIHAYIYTDIQKYGTQGSYIIGQDDRSYFPSTYEGKTYGFRNTLDENSTKNTFILYIEPRILEQKIIHTPTIETEKKNSSWFKVGETLQEFFYEKTSTTFQILGLLIAVFAGMMHGLLPGHSKALIGTYMMSHSQIRYREILILIGSVTFSHTIFIFVLATIVLALQKGLSTVTAYVVTLSSIGYIAFGIYFYIKGTRSLHATKHSENPLAFSSYRIHGDNNCDCHRNLSDKKSLRGTTLSGILAGANPCIDALALFIFAITIGNGVYAFLVIIFFSFGLGLMLGILAIFVKQCRSLMQKKSQKLAEQISAHITILAGIAIIIMGSYTLLF